MERGECWLALSGFHVCEFCLQPPEKKPPPETTGNGEIRVVDVHGITYVAPVLVLHYVVAHEYLPPPKFTEAAIKAAAAA
jgi:hypothetical protein